MTESNLRFCPDAVLRRHGHQWLATNPRTHTHVAISETAFAAIADLGGGGSSAKWREKLQAAEGYDRTAFDLRHGLWSDPSRLSDPGPMVSGEKLLKLLNDRWIICAEGEEDYRAFLQPLTSILDRKHLGTLHQLIGQHVGVTLRIRDEWRWWHDSKFHPDGKTLRPGPYKWVQETFFDSYFDAINLKDTRVLDFACGNGYYARKFAARGAEVLGIDTAAELIALARRNSAGTCRFEDPSNPEKSLQFLKTLAPASFDRVYMSDILLLLLQPNTDPGYAAAVMSTLCAVLKPGGRLHLFEPNPMFWLGCRVGSGADPMVVISEYRRQLYTVAPTLDHVMALMNTAGFVLAEFIHPPGDKVPDEEHDLKQFANAFPLWDFLTFEKRP